MNAHSKFLRWPAEHSKAYDVLAAAPVIAWYGLSVSKIVPAIWRKLESTDLAAADLTFAFSLLAQIAGVFFILLVLTFVVLRAPAKRKAQGLMPRLMAICGTYFGAAVVWLPPQPMGFALSLVSLSLILGGIAFSVFSLVHLGRSFSLMAEARRLVTDGPYALIRHPLYLGEAFALFGLALQYRSPLAFLFIALQFAFQFQRMKNEEAVLARQFPEYETYRLQTARIFPGLY